MKFYKVCGLLILVLLMSVTAFAETGPFVDKVYFDVRMQEDIAIQDVAKGNTDIFFYGLDGPKVMGLSEDILNKLDVYAIPSGSWSIFINPIPNKAPYTWELDGKEIFNPMAIRELRYALNWLINRQYIVDEILGGAGGPMFNHATPGQPGTYRYGLIASKLGMVPEGDEERAIKEINAVLQKAAELPHNQGRLKREEKWWTFDGEPLSVKFIIRVDDPQGRMREGEYIAQQIEKTGIKVERLLWDRAKANGTVYSHDPADLEWQLYTEGWGAGATRRFWTVTVTQMYAPWLGYMPGKLNPENWRYTHERIDELTEKAYSGKFMTEEEYFDYVLEATELGVQEAVRLHVCYQDQYFLANKDRMNRMVYGRGDGLNRWSLMTAKTDDGILRATQYSAKGGLFMAAWDPVGEGGFSDTFTRNISDSLYEQGMIETPVTAIDMPSITIPLDCKTKVIKDDDGKMVGYLKVPANAVRYDSGKKEWVEVGEGVTAMATGTYEFHPAKYHHGIPISLVDYLYASAFVKDWITEDFPGDPYYCPEYEANVVPNKTDVATIYDFDNERITTYHDKYFPLSKERQVKMISPSWTTSTKAGVGVCWEISEALARMVAEGSASGEVYSFSQTKSGTVEVDVLRPTCVQDIRAELVKMKEENHVPIYIKDFITVEEAKNRYQAAIDFIDKYNNAYISNGAFYLSKFDPDANFIELTAFRDGYPFEVDHWLDLYCIPIYNIDRVGVPAMNEKGKDIMVTANVSKTIFPETTGEPAKEGEVRVILLKGTEELVYEANFVKDGVFMAKIPGEATKDCEPGTYTILIQLFEEGNVAATVSNLTVIY